MSNDEAKKKSTPLEEIPLGKILLDSNIITNNVRTNADGVKQLLKKCDMWCDPYESATTDKEVKKLLTLAVHEAFQDKVNLAEIGNTGTVNNDTENTRTNSSETESSKQVKKELQELLEIAENKSLNDYFEIPEKFKKAKSPLDVAQYLKEDVSEKFIENLFECQFSIRWSTDTGAPGDFTYYQFFDKASKIKERIKHYTPRQAQIKATLYKECIKSNLYLQGIDEKKKLCPKVYVRTSVGWQACQTANNDEFIPVENINNDLSWIDKDILQLITKNSDVQSGDSPQNLKDCLTKPALYWAVLEDRDVKDDEQLGISRTQVYVGKSLPGIKTRWITDGKSHCTMMKKCLENVCAMTTYDALRLEGIYLVDARLALAKVRGEKTALFVMKTFGDEIEKAKQDIPKYLDVKYLNKDIPSLTKVLEELKQFLDEIESLLDEAAQSKKKLDEINEHLNKIKKYSPEWVTTLEERLKDLQTSKGKKLSKKITSVKSELSKFKHSIECLRNKLEQSRKNADKKLKNAEKQHLKGEIKLVVAGPDNNQNVKWKPTDIRYGMNRY